MQRTTHRIIVLIGAALMLAACEGTPFHDDITAQARENANMHFGEASVHNLVAMTANRRDLYTPRRETPADAARRDGTIAAYRTSGTGAQSAQTASTEAKQ